jgi:hypothetical protein
MFLFAIWIISKEIHKVYCGKCDVMKAQNTSSLYTEILL